VSFRWVRPVVALAWTAALAGSYGWMVSSVPDPIDIHGPVEVAFGILLVLTAPMGWIGAYGAYAIHTVTGWPQSPAGILATVWIGAGLLGLLQWFVFVPILWNMLTEHFRVRNDGLALSRRDGPG
jgi:hypothetical protein